MRKATRRALEARHRRTRCPHLFSTSSPPPPPRFRRSTNGIQCAIATRNSFHLGRPLPVPSASSLRPRCATDPAEACGATKGPVALSVTCGASLPDHRWAGRTRALRPAAHLRPMGDRPLLAPRLPTRAAVGVPPSARAAKCLSDGRPHFCAIDPVHSLAP